MDTQSWHEFIPNLSEVLDGIAQTRIIFVGRTPYTKIIPSLFLKKERYVIYSLHDCKEIDTLRQYCPVYSFEEKFPERVGKINSVAMLVHSKEFQNNFLKSQKGRYALMFNVLTEHLHSFSTNKNIALLGNNPKLPSTIGQKIYFRTTLKQLGLPCPTSMVIERTNFLRGRFNDFRNRLGGAFVCQRGDDSEAIDGMNTIFVRNEIDFRRALEEFSKREERTRRLFLTKLIEGYPVNMLGCVVGGPKILTSPLQSQLIDLPELLQGEQPRGRFMGLDWGLRSWGEEIELEAERVLQKIGSHLYERWGYRGIYDIDFIWDERNNRIFPIECNPHFTSSFPFDIAICLDKGLPPFELFHLGELMGISADYNFETLKSLYKQPVAASHVYINASKVDEMRPDIQVGISRMGEDGRVEFARAGVFPWDVRDKSEFLLIDAVYKKGQKLPKGNRIFQLFFPCSVAESSERLKPEYRKITQYFVNRLMSG